MDGAVACRARSGRWSGHPVRCWGRTGQGRATPGEGQAPIRARGGGVDLAGDVALEAADDLCLGSFRGAALGVGAGGRVGAQAGEHDPPQRVVGVAVSAWVEPVPGNLPRDAAVSTTHAQDAALIVMEAQDAAMEAISIGHATEPSRPLLQAWTVYLATLKAQVADQARINETVRRGQAVADALGTRHADARARWKQLVAMPPA